MIQSSDISNLVTGYFIKSFEGIIKRAASNKSGLLIKKEKTKQTENR